MTVGSGKDTAKAAYGNPSSLLHLLDRLLRPARTTVYPVVILILWPLAWFVMMLIGPDPFMVDFVARWTGGRMAGQGAFGDLYDTVAQMGFQNGLFANENALSWFVGPPFEAVILVPFGALPYPLSTLLWTSASLAALTISLRLLCKQQMPSVINWRRFVIIAFASVPVTELLYSGQNTAFVLLWLVLAQHSIDRDRPFAAGLILGLALVKPHLVALLPTLWLLERRWKALAGLATATACWIVVSIVIVGPTSLLRWLAALQSGLYIGGVHEGQTVKNAGVVGLLTPWIPVTGTAPWESLATVASLAAGLLVILFVWRNTTDPALRWWLVVLATVITAPHAMTYDLVLAIPAIGLAMTRWWTAPIRVSIAITWIAFWIVPAIGLALSPVEWLAQYAATPWHVIPLIVASGVILKQLQSPPICQLQARKVALNPRIPTDPA